MKPLVISNVEKIKQIFKRNKSPQLNKLTEAFNFVVKNNYLLLSIEEVNFTLYSNISPSYEFQSKSINIPLSYEVNFNGLYKDIESYVRIKSSEYIIFHEIGHAIQHSSIGNKNYIFEPIELNSKLNYLFNGASVANKINHFLSDNFKESYADCYAAFNLYKKYGDINIFDIIYNYRESEKVKFKVANPVGINEYFNHEDLLIFKSSLGKNEPFEKIHELIQSSIVKSMFNTLIAEMKINDSFLKEVKLFGLEFNKQDPVSGFLKEFKTRSNEIIKEDIDQLMKESLFYRNVDGAEPLNSIRKYGYNFLIDNITELRRKSLNETIIKSGNKPS